ncbi:MAG: heavy-metal-associated domain-containing protein [Bacteroidia bacterium]|jgi:copper chaperone CopZ|nr:heavy-metal-associated domain-containing protein [Bacteroidia bacterium]
MNKKEIIISGISCMSCVNKIEKQLYTNTAVNKITIDKNTGSTILEAIDMPSEINIQGLLSEIGDYKIGKLKKNFFSSPYKPLILILFYLTIVTLSIELSSGIFLWETWMANFMAGFFLIFSFFKLLDIPAFANAYQSYDIIASRFRFYGYIYPFIELGLGLAYIYFYDSDITNLTTAIVMFVGLIGVSKSVIQKSMIQCACLGTVFNLPMSYITIIENGIMLSMALFMLL